MKKILALCLSIILVVSSLAMTVSAAEMITVTVPAQTLIDQDFYAVENGANVALTAIPDGWTKSYGTEGTTFAFSTTGIKAKNYNGFSIYKDEAFNAQGADYTFSITMATYNGANYVHFGATTAADAYKNGISDTGYTMHALITSDNKYSDYTIYKNGLEIGSLEDKGNAYDYQSDRTFTFKVTAESITVTGAGDTFTVADKDPITSGYVGLRLRSNSGTKTNLNSISLVTDEYSYEMEKPAEVVTGAKVTYEKPGSSYLDVDLRGAAALPAGVTAGGTYSFGASGLTWSGNPNVTTSFGTVEVPSDVTNFTVEARYTAKYNGAPVFSFLGYKLTKKGDYNGTKTYTLAKGTETLGTGTLGAAFYAGSVPVKVTFAGNNITVNVDGNDVITATDANVSKSGVVSIASGYTGSWTVGNVYIASPASDVTKTNFLMDKTFSNNDTIASLNADGYSITGTFNTTTVNGIDGTASGGIGKFMYEGATFEGGYTAELKFYCTDNVPSMYFNYVDANNYYKLNTNASKKFSLTKSVKGADDAEATVTTLIDGAANSVGTLLSAESGYNIKLTILDDKSMDIEITCIGLASTCKFDKVNDPTPITSGKIRYESGWSRANYGNYVKSLKVYPTPAEGEDAVKYSAGFKVGANDATEIAKGNTMFTFPIAMIGQTPDFIAVLYEDYKMADIKIIDVKDINEGIVSLFDTTSSTSDNISISVFVWNSLEGMVPVLETYTLD